MQALDKRLKNAEQSAKQQSKFSPVCICFPDNEQPFFCLPEEEETTERRSVLTG